MEKQKSIPKNNLAPFPIIASQGPSKCACSKNEQVTAVPIESLKQSSPISLASRFLPLWLWALAGLLILLVLMVGFGMVPGMNLDGLRREVLFHLTFVTKAVWSILPYFAISVTIAAWVTVSGFSERIHAIFKRKEAIAILGAAVIGASVPLCSCGVIPFIAALLAGGVPLGPVMAFWLSSPLMSPSKFFVTAGVLGLHYAFAMLISAIVIGAGTGYFIFWLTSRGRLSNQLQGLSLAKGACCSSKTKKGPHEKIVSGFWKKFWPELGKVSLFLGKWLLVAFVLEALIVHYVDPSWISYLLGKEQTFSIPIATAVGIPLYTSGVSAIPIVQGLLKTGMGPGAALAFLTAGAVTTIPAMTAVFALVKRQTFLIYLGAGILGSLITGYIFQFIFS